MEKDCEYTAGWIDTSVHDFLSQIADPTASMTYALVTCLDSSFDLAAIVQKDPDLRTLKSQGQLKIVGQGVLLTTRRLLALERRKRLFFGFDEVWFFPRAKVSPKPKNAVITGPGKITPQLMKSLANWMQANGCSLGLGDGAGMNFCARLRGIAQYLVDSFNASDSNGDGHEKALVAGGQR